MTDEHARPDFAQLNGWDRPYEVFLRPEVPAYTGVTLSFCNRPLVEDPVELAAPLRWRMQTIAHGVSDP